MTLDEAIQHCKEVAIEYEAKGECYECGKEHRQLAEWLEDYKQLKAHFDSLPDYIPVWVSRDEAMPEDGGYIVMTEDSNLPQFGYYSEKDACWMDWEGCTMENVTH